MILGNVNHAGILVLSRQELLFMTLALAVY
jgi:hypothetical protein